MICVRKELRYVSLQHESQQRYINTYFVSTMIVRCGWVRGVNSFIMVASLEYKLLLQMGGRGGWPGLRSGAETPGTIPVWTPCPGPPSWCQSRQGITPVNKCSTREHSGDDTTCWCSAYFICFLKILEKYSWFMKLNNNLTII